MKQHPNEFVHCLGEVRIYHGKHQQLWQVTDANGYRQEWRDVPIVGGDTVRFSWDPPRKSRCPRNP